MRVIGYPFSPSEWMWWAHRTNPCILGSPVNQTLSWVIMQAHSILLLYSKCIFRTKIGINDQISTACSFSRQVVAL